MKLLLKTTLILFVAISTSDSYAQLPVVKNAIKRMNPICPPDTAHDSYLFGIGGFVCTRDGKLIFADHQEGAIRVFSIESGKELFRFSKKGRGPGEFQVIGKMKLEDGDLVTIDEGLLRASFFTLKGQLIKTFSLWQRTSDVVFLGHDRMLTSSYRFDNRHKPLKLLEVSSGKILREFGHEADVQKGLTEKFMKLFPANAGMYESVVISLRLLNNGKVLYSQRNPYYLCLYDVDSGVGREIAAPLDIDMQDQLIAEPFRETGARFTSKPSPTVLAPQTIGDSIYVAIFSLDRKSNFLDCYDIAGKFIKRMRIPPLDPQCVPVGLSFNNRTEMIILVMGAYGVMWFERYSMRL